MIVASHKVPWPPEILFNGAQGYLSPPLCSVKPLFLFLKATFQARGTRGRVELARTIWLSYLVDSYPFSSRFLISETASELAVLKPEKGVTLFTSLRCSLTFPSPSLPHLHPQAQNRGHLCVEVLNCTLYQHPELYLLWSPPPQPPGH